MARFTAENTLLAKEIIGRYPLAKSALIPLLHLAQQQDGYVTDDAMVHIAELVGVTPADVLGTCSFYEMFKRQPVGDYVVNVCTNISCMLLGGEELLHHLEDRLDVRAGSTTADGVFTLEDVECIAACTEAPCLQVNYRYFHQITHEQADALIDDLRAGRRAHDIPKHGTLSRIRQHIPTDRRAGVALPTDPTEPAWLAAPEPATPERAPEAVREQAREAPPDEAAPEEQEAEAELVDEPDPQPASEAVGTATAVDDEAEASKASGSADTPGDPADETEPE